MGKIPVGKTISYAYSFAFGHILNILGVAWFPFVLMGVAGYFLLMPMAAQLPAMQDMSGFGNLLLFVFAFIAVALICKSMVVVEVMREALGMDPGQKFFYFSLDKPVWRLIGAYALCILVVIGLEIVGGIALGILGMVAGMAGASAAGIIFSAGSVVFTLALVLIVIRLTFLLPAVVVAENHISLRRGWHLTYGNFWRIVGVVLAIVIPIWFVFGILCTLIFGLDFTTKLSPNSSQEEIANALQQLQAQIQSGLIFVVPVSIIISILNLGLTCGAGAFAYRALTSSQGSSSAR